MRLERNENVVEDFINNAIDISDSESNNNNMYDDPLQRSKRDVFYQIEDMPPPKSCPVKNVI